MPERANRAEPHPENRLRRLARARYGGALGVPAFRWLWALALFAGGSEAIATVAMPLLVYDLTSSPGLLGVMFVLQQAPRMLLSPVAGVVADRVDRRLVLFWSALVRALLAAMIPFTSEIWQIAALAMFLAAANALARPCELAALPSILEGRQMIEGLSLIQVTNNVMRIIGPAAGAAVISLTTPANAFWLQAAALLASAYAAWRLVLPPKPSEIAWTGWKTGLQSGWGDIADGMRTVLHSPIVRGIIAAESLWSLVSAAMIIAGVVLTEQALDLGNRAEGAFGALTASFSAGAVIGALAASRLEQAIGRNRMLAIGYTGPLLLIPVLALPPLPVIFIIWIVFGIADALAVVALQSYMAEAVPDSLRGRVYATWIAAVTAFSLGSYAAIGWLTGRIGAPETFALVGIVTGLGGPFLLWITGALASLRHPQDSPG